MKFHSRSKTLIAALLTLSLLATGCNAQWISVALADLPVLLQMALNIGTIVTTLQSGQQLSAAEASAIQNISNEASKDLNLLQVSVQRLQNRPECCNRPEDSGSDCRHQCQLPGFVASGAYQRCGALGKNYCRGESNSDDSK